MKTVGLEIDLYWDDLNEKTKEDIDALIIHAFGAEEGDKHLHKLIKNRLVTMKNKKVWQIKF